jgi:hypothetical protein
VDGLRRGGHLERENGWGALSVLRLRILSSANVPRVPRSALHVLVREPANIVATAQRWISSSAVLYAGFHDPTQFWLFRGYYESLRVNVVLQTPVDWAVSR